jgi:broad specificity phosphatase PhoE
MSHPPSTTLVLVRHGETLGNREGRFQVYDTPLSDAGRAQAARLAERLAAEPPADALYCSDLARASETAAIVGRRLGLAPIADAALRELDVGDWKGLLRAEVLSRSPGSFDEWFATGAIERLPGEAGECAEDVAQRALAWLERTVERHRGGRVIAVSHGLTLMILLAEIHGWDRVETFRTSRAAQGNTAVNVVEIRADGGRTCTLLGCTAHLDGLASIESRAI